VNFLKQLLESNLSKIFQPLCTLLDWLKNAGICSFSLFSLRHYGVNASLHLLQCQSLSDFLYLEKFLM